MLVTNAIRAEAVFVLEQFVRALDRYKLALCAEHGCPYWKCVRQHHAHARHPAYANEEGK